MENFSLWTKENVNDIIFNFSKKNAELLRNFINWYNYGENYIYILSNREFYSTECLILLQSTINSFINIKNDDLEETVVEEKNNLEEKIIDENIAEENNDEQKDDLKETIIDENDSDEYVINDEYYCNKNEVVKDLNEEIEDLNKNNEDNT